MTADRIASGLYVVATPLGNVEDLSPRAARILADADLVLAEDTRRAGLLMQRLGIARRDGLGFMSFHEHNEVSRTPAIVERLREGDSVAMVTDAGTPLLSDPGYSLVRACRVAGLPVHPVPGPSAAVTALSACGLPPQPYTFLGFAPRKTGQAVRLFELHGATGATLVLFERKSRLQATLEAAYTALGPREFCLCREMTKDYEEFLPGYLGRLEELSQPVESLKGEFTIVIGPPSEEKSTEEEVIRILAEEHEQGGKTKEISRRVAARVRGWTAKEVYAMSRSAQ